jgi:asparagine synthase (glutamine-hydrolysing)
MCGIAGFVQKQELGDSSQSFENRLTLMTDRMAKRGPDGSGHWISEVTSHSGQSWRAALGHRRLSIIDLEGGAQPLGNENGRIQITFNGEIFNFQALRPDLEIKGHRFRTRSDTEVIVHHFEQYGEEGIRDLNGMFAFGLWDQDRCRLVLARDRAGIKPLYYCRLPDGGLAFASELTALTQHPEVRRKLSMDAVSGYFFSDYFQSPESILEGVFKLDPGCFLVWENGKLSEPQSFWRIQEFLKEHPLEKKRFSVKESSAQLEHLLETSVERQLISDVPVGVFLSGGIDSSVIAALARKKAGKGIRTFSIAFEDKDFDESGFARQVARHIGTDH